MSKKFQILINTLLLLYFIPIAAQEYPAPKHEVRAVWIATVMGLDWPKSLAPIVQQQTLHEIVMNLKGAHFNTLFFQVRGRADAIYKSYYEPWSHILTGTLGQDPGWDPLAFIIEDAHANGMEMHAWFNTFLVKSGGTLPSESEPRHIMLQHPEWIYRVNGEWWLNPGIPAVRDYMVNVAMDLVRNYDVDGIQFDFIRYPGRNIPDEETYRQFGNGLSKDDWRRENVNKFLRAFHDSVRLLKPILKIGATPIGIYTNFEDTRGQQSYSELYQDSRQWLKEGIVDYLVPQVYWSLGTTRGDPDFALIAKDWAKYTFGRHIYIGIGAYKSDVLSEIPSLIDTVRSAGLDGVSFFRYENIKNAMGLGERFQTLSIIPPMAWKDSAIPVSPISFEVSNISDGIFQLRWTLPDPSLGDDAARSFAIYRSSHQPMDVTTSANLIAIVSEETDSFIDTISHITASKYYYAITSLNKEYNESQPAIESIVIPEIVELARRYEFRFTLGQNYPNPASDYIFIPYEIGATSPVIIKLIDDKNQEVISVVDAIQPPGRYVAAARISNLKDGNYSYLLMAGAFSQKRIFRIDN
ncbi:MAG: family 10 glycosylhydrolase [Bacteroidota bacterium]|nr:family 10 glycosylhydrolase [Bacteroidota bacterium]